MIDYGTVSILMGTFNGERYIKQQLDSIFSQTYKNWVLYVSDDGSTDNTLNIIRDFKDSLPDGKIILLNGPGKGFSANFLNLLRNNSINSPYYAFSDQDDIWLDKKLEVSLKHVSRLESLGNKQVLYGGRTTLINNQLEILGFSPLFKKNFSFNNALIQSFSGGNTMFFNHALKELIERLPPEINIVSHDWFLYILCSGVGGKIYYDPISFTHYRQHDGNLVGSNNGLISKYKRLRRLFDGDFKKWTDLNDVALAFYEQNLTLCNQKVLHDFRKCGSPGLTLRLRSFVKAKLYRQNIIETLIFMLMSMLNKLK